MGTPSQYEEIYQTSNHQIDDRTQFWQFLTETPTEPQQNRKNLRLFRKIVRQENLALCLLHDGSSKLKLPSPD